MNHLFIASACLLGIFATATNSCQTEVAPKVTPTTKIDSPESQHYAEVRFLDKDGHRFAVILYDRGAGICEVTDASIIKPEKP